MKFLSTIFLMMSFIFLHGQSDSTNQHHFTLGAEYGLGRYYQINIMERPFYFNALNGEQNYKSSSLNMGQIVFSWQTGRSEITAKGGFSVGKLTEFDKMDSLLVSDSTGSNYTYAYAGLEINGIYTHYFITGVLLYNYYFFQKGKFKACIYSGVGFRHLTKKKEHLDITFQALYEDQTIDNQFTSFTALKSIVFTGAAGVKVSYQVLPYCNVWLSVFGNSTLMPDNKENVGGFKRYSSTGIQIGAGYMF